MTAGIYALYWWEQDLVYIGQSINIEIRHKEHFNKLKNHKHSNYKVQEAYDTYGAPEHILLEVCTINMLSYMEVYWTNEFNSLALGGLNIVYPGSYCGYGTEALASKYSKKQILQVFRLLSATLYTPVQTISKYTGVSIASVRSLLYGKSHNWLSIYYPFRYSLMILGKNRHMGKKRDIEKRSMHIYSPQGECFIVESITEFSSKYSLNSKLLSRVLYGLSKNHKGWYTSTTKVVSPTGEVFEVNNITKFAKLHGLHQSHFSELVSGEVLQHKGWTLLH